MVCWFFFNFVLGVFVVVCLLFAEQIVALQKKIKKKKREKHEAAWLADLTNVMVSDNEAFTSCSRDIQIVTSKAMLELI